MTRGAMVLLALGMALPTTAVPAPDQPYYCEIRTRRTQDKQVWVETARIWLQHSTKYRFEQTVEGKTQITIVNDKDLWIVYPVQKNGIHVRQKPAELAALRQRSRVARDIVRDFLKAGGKKTGQQKLAGKVYDLYKRSDRNGLTYTLFVLPGPGRLTRRAEVSGNVNVATRPGQAMTNHRLHSVTDFTNWQVGKPLNEALFRPPAGIKITEAPATPGPGERQRGRP